MSKSNKRPKIWFDEADFEPDHVYEQRKRKEERKKKADQALLDDMYKHGFGG
jgi:hypothetical protein